MNICVYIYSTPSTLVYFHDQLEFKSSLTRSQGVKKSWDTKHFRRVKSHDLPMDRSRIEAGNKDKEAKSEKGKV